MYNKKCAARTYLQTSCIKYTPSVPKSVKEIIETDIVSTESPSTSRSTCRAVLAD